MGASEAHRQAPREGSSRRLRPDTTLDEGQAIEHVTIAASGSSKVEVTGELWSKPFASSLAPTPEQAKLASALVFGSDLFTQLSEAERMVLAMKGGAVSPVTSYLAIEPGVRPSNDGIAWAKTAFGSGGGGVGHAFGSGGLRHFVHVSGGFDEVEWLKGQLGAAAKRPQSERRPERNLRRARDDEDRDRPDRSRRDVAVA